MLRRKGYLKFYRKMKNIRRVPFIVVSTGKKNTKLQIAQVMHVVHEVYLLSIFIFCLILLHLPFA